MNRSEIRSRAVVAVMLTSLDGRLTTEFVFTEDISSYGVRVLAKQRWRSNDSLLIKSLEGDFVSEARVIYSNVYLTKKNCHVIGLSLLQPMGKWKYTLGRSLGQENLTNALVTGTPRIIVR